MNVDNANVITQMPSLIQAPYKLEFGVQWPVNLTLPSLQMNQLPGNKGYTSKAKSSKQALKNSYARACSHTNKRAFAKSMCHSCYQQRGRNKKAWKCNHSTKPHYAKGMCQICYLKTYYKSKKEDQPSEDEEKGNEINQSEMENDQEILTLSEGQDKTCDGGKQQPEFQNEEVQVGNS